MYTEVLKHIIIEGQELLQDLNPISRPLDMEAHARYVFVGIRQAGKSYMLYLRALQLIAEGHELSEMLFVNFDDERLIGFKATDLDSILKAYSSLFPHRPVLFLDEIQNVAGWEHFARRLANQKYIAYITGSNAKMLSKDIASTLGARFVERYVFPFSFREYLQAKGVEIDDNWYLGRSRGEVERQLAEYFQWGGFPESLLFANKRQWLNQLYEKILLGDIVVRNSIRNEGALRLTVKRLAETLRTPASFNRLAGMVKASGYPITPTSVIDYVGYCKDACMVFALENWASKFVERNTVKKHYFIDNGLLNIFLTDSETSLLENLCAITLYRRQKADPRLEFYFYNKEVELDFYIPHLRKGIQSCYSLHDPETLEREVRALTSYHRLYGLDAAEIVTYSEEMTIQREGLSIRVVPLSKWLLQS